MDEAQMGMKRPLGVATRRCGEAACLANSRWRLGGGGGGAARDNRRRVGSSYLWRQRAPDGS